MKQAKPSITSGLVLIVLTISIIAVGLSSGKGGVTGAATLSNCQQSGSICQDKDGNYYVKHQLNIYYKYDTGGVVTGQVSTIPSGSFERTASDSKLFTSIPQNVIDDAVSNSINPTSSPFYKYSSQYGPITEEIKLNDPLNTPKLSEEQKKNEVIKKYYAGDYKEVTIGGKSYEVVELNGELYKVTEKSYIFFWENKVEKITNNNELTEAKQQIEFQNGISVSVGDDMYIIEVDGKEYLCEEGGTGCIVSSSNTYTEQLNQEKILLKKNEERAVRVQEIKGIINDMNVAQGTSQAIQDMIGVDLSLDWRQWGDAVGYIMGGNYESALCDMKRSNYFIQDYAGHYATDGGYPTLGAMVYAVGRRSEYTGIEWQTNCEFNGEQPKWFPKINASGSDEPQPNGYLYKISWYIGYPFNDYDVDTWSETERESRGLEADGSIKYSIKLEGIKCDAMDLPGKYDMPMNKSIPMGGSVSVTHAYYDKAYMERICVVFDDFEYDGSTKEWCSDLKTEELEAPPNFGFFPQGTGSVSSSTDSNSTNFGTSAASEEQDSACPFPPNLCESYGYETP